MKKLNHLIFGEGSATGNKHIISKGNATLYEGDDKELVLEVKSAEVVATHNTHDPVIIKKAGKKAKKFNIGTVIEYDHFTEESRKVMD